MKIEKSKGVTPTEKRLSNLCERTFLKLWSWPNPYKQDGKELCDLIAVFDDHVFVFFDRESNTIQDAEKDINVTWSRWKKEVIDKQMKTAKGAERYIKNCQPIYLDSKCQQPFPVTMPENPIIHKIIVAHGAKDVCKSFAEDNVYGSLGMFYGDFRPDQFLPFCTPFFVQLEKDNPIHILDSSNLEILLTELDTFSDFVSFLSEKEKAISKYDGLVYCGEEDLLAHYFLNYDENLKRYRIEEDSPNINTLWIEEGKWKNFKENGHAERRTKANKESYFWDELVQDTYQNALDGTASGVNLWSNNDPLHEMAKEPRMARRDLSRIMLQAITDFPSTDNDIFYMPRYMQSLSDRSKMYVFLQLKCPEANLDKNRERRRHVLVVACGVVRNNFSDIKTVIGIAMEPPKYARSNAEDFVLLKCEQWSEEQRAYFDRENEKFGFLKNARKLERRVVDFEQDLS